MTRHGFVVNVRPDKREEYLALHRAVWTRVEEAMSEQGIRNYTIFILDDTLFGYYEYAGDDYEADMAKIQLDATSQQWWELTGPCQTPFGRSAAPTDGWRRLEELWHLP